jgi:cytochrome b6-f complex iron-sulfur subunit
MEHNSRRDFLRNAWKLGGALLIGAAGYTGYEALRPLTTGAGGAKLTVGDIQNFPTNTSTYVPAGRMYVVNANDHLFALSQKCPHLGCRVPYCDSSGRFECPCHGSVFDLAGEYIQGPAPRGMDQYEVTLDGRNVVVDTGALKSGPDRGAKTYLTPPKGPSCIGKS